MKVREIMTPNPETIGPEHAIGAALTIMRSEGLRRLPVVLEGQVVGIISDRDLRLAMNSPHVLTENWFNSYLMEHITVRNAMTADLITIGPDGGITEAIGLMEEHRVGSLLVIDKETLVGIITVADLLSYLKDLLTEQ